MKTNPKGLAIIQEFESLQLAAYPDPASPLFAACGKARISPYGHGYRALVNWQQYSGAPWTIGWGHTGDEVKPGLEIDRATADRWLHADVEAGEAILDRALTRPIGSNAYSAFLSALYNIGPGRKNGRSGLIQLSDGRPSTALRRLNVGDIKGAFVALLAWNKAGGQVLRGLERRRQAEHDLGLTPD